VEPAVPADFQCSIDGAGPVRVWQRPYLAHFLEQSSSLGELVLFTSATEEYARAILSHVDPRSCLFSRVFSRRRCHQIAPGLFAKDLNVVGTSLARTVLIDDLPTSFSLQPDNGIPIPPFLGDPNDNSLQNLLSVLSALSDAHDVRPLLTTRYAVRSTLERLVREHRTPKLRPREQLVDRHPM